MVVNELHRWLSLNYIDGSKIEIMKRKDETHIAAKLTTWLISESSAPFCLMTYSFTWNKCFSYISLCGRAVFFTLLIIYVINNLCGSTTQKRSFQIE